MQQPHVTVVILNWNGLEHLEECLSALRRQDYPAFTAVVVDNASTDGSVAFVRERFPEVRVVVLRENRGFAGGNNAVLRELETPYYALLNNDTAVEPGWLSSLVNALETRPEFGAAASRMMNYWDRGIIDNCGDDVTVIGTTIDRGRGQRMSAAFAAPVEVFCPCAGAALYRLELLRDVGVLDDDFFTNYEDVDHGFRARRRGWRTIYVPDAVVYHKVHGTLRKVQSRSVYYSQRNVEWLWMKNMPTTMMLAHLPMRLVYEVGSMIYFIRAGQFRAFIRAKRDAWLRVPALWRQRRTEQRANRISPDELRRAMVSGAIRSKLAKFFARRAEGVSAR